MRRAPAVLASIVLTCVGWGTASAQDQVATDGLSLADALGVATRTDVSSALTDALVLGTQLEVGTSLLPVGSSGFTFSFDRQSGVDVRTPRTFGPSFAHRVPTFGKDRLTMGVTLVSSSYDDLGDFSLDRMNPGSVTVTRSDGSPDRGNSLTGTSSLVLSSQSLIISTGMGMTDNLDVSVSVPLVKVDLDGMTFVENGFLENGAPELARLVSTTGRSSGVGDLMLGAKYRLPFRFGDQTALHDSGGVGLLVRARLPTGDPDNLRGLGVTRVMGSVLVSGGSDDFGFHANAGYEWWSDDLTFQSDASGVDQHTLGGMIEYVAGVEFAAVDAMTVMFDVMGRHFGGGGAVVETTAINPDGFPISFMGLSATENLQKIALAPGLKLSLRGSNLLLSLNALIPISDNGLHDTFTPVVGLDWVF